MKSALIKYCTVPNGNFTMQMLYGGLDNSISKRAPPAQCARFTDVKMPWLGRMTLTYHYGKVDVHLAIADVFISKTRGALIAELRDCNRIELLEGLC